MKLAFCLPKFVLYNIDQNYINSTSNNSNIFLQSNLDLYKMKVIQNLFSVYNISYEIKGVVVDTPEYNEICKKSGASKFPILQVDQIYFPSFSAICRHLAARFGLHGSTLTEETYCDVMSSMLFDIISIIERGADSGSVREQDDAMHEAVEHVNTILGPYIIHYIKNLRGESLTHTDYLFGKDPIWIDFALQELILLVNNFGKGRVYLTSSVKTFVEAGTVC
uniref:GST N-terminal domain-containing protein n=1 Tax=Strongyloides venezuelensis TaxID=75913 RepID=A0A0K0FAC2_STRVS